MSDNQSENSSAWRAPSGVRSPKKPAGWEHEECDNAIQIAAAEEAVRVARENVWAAEDALLAAKSALSTAEGKLCIIKDRPTWKQIFVPGVLMPASDVYKVCVQAGYSYALWNGKIVRVGPPDKQFIDTGAVEADIK